MLRTFLIVLARMALVLAWIVAAPASFALLVGLILTALQISSIFNQLLPSWGPGSYILALCGLAVVEYVLQAMLSADSQSDALRERQPTKGEP